MPHHYVNDAREASWSLGATLVAAQQPSDRAPCCTFQQYDA